MSGNDRKQPSESLLRHHKEALHNLQVLQDIDLDEKSRLTFAERYLTNLEQILILSKVVFQ